MPTATSAEGNAAVELLSTGELEVEGQLSDASNVALRVWVSNGNRRIPAVYKPVRGERPLWDFPDGTLAGREVGAWLVSQRLGWGCVPPTVLRDGPLGPGSVQAWVGPLDVRDATDLLRIDPPDEVPPDHVAVLAVRDERARPLVVSHADRADLRDIALLDALLNNADRKGSALVLDGDALWAVDHGLTFHEDDKLRTVLWGFAGDVIAPNRLDDLCRVSRELGDGGDLATSLGALLSAVEVRGLQARADELIHVGRFPAPPEDRHPLPWPLW